MGLLAFCVIYAVIARYFFGISHTFLEEFITAVFAFTTFWGVGICFIENEHVVIDSIIKAFPPPLYKIVIFFDYAVTLLVLGVMTYFGAAYALKYGHQISFGMRIPYVWMYGIIPLGCFIAIICVIIRLRGFVKSMFPHNTKRV
jgi:TRAP-type C4-dicarboxylate transport system permease small subunit